MKIRKVKWFNFIIWTGMSIGLMILLCVGVFLPYRLEVTVKTDRLYENQSVQKQDLQVETVSLFGLRTTCESFDVKSHNDMLTVQSGGLSMDIEVNPIPVSYLTAEYHGKLYQFDKLNMKQSDFLVRAVYEDSMVKDVDTSHIDMGKFPIDSKEDFVMTLKAFGKSVNVMIRPIKVMNLQVSYQDGLHIGDTFDKTKLQMTVQFADGVKRSVKDFSCDFEGIVQSDSQICVVSDVYGESVLQVDKSNIESYDMEYRHPVYEGDVLKPEDLKFSVIYTDKSVAEITDLSFDPVQVFPGTKVNFASKLFGTMSGVINPVRVQEITATSFVDKEGKLVVETIQLLYADGHVRELSVNDVTWITDLSKPLQAGNHEIQFDWCGHKYSFMTRILS